MSTPEGVTVSFINFTNYLPEKLPSAEEIRSSGKTFKATGTKIDTTYTHTTTQWNKLAEAATYPHDATVNNAFVKEILPLAEAVVLGINDVTAATDAFAESLESFKTRYSTLKTDVENLNALPATTYSDEQKATAQDDGETLPTTRTTAEFNRLMGLLKTAKTDYDGYVTTCVDAIKAANPVAVDPYANAADKTAKTIGAFKNSYNMVNTNVDRAASLDVNKRGRIGFSWDIKEKSLSEFAFDGNPTLKKFLIDGKLGGDAENFFNRNKKALVNLMDSKYLKFTDDAKAWGDIIARPGLLMMLPAGVRNKLSNTIGQNRRSFENKNHRRIGWDSNSHGKTKVSGYLTGWRKSGKLDDTLKKFDKAKKGLDKLGKSKIGKLAGPAGGIIDVGSTYVDSYTRNLEEAQRANPDASMADLRKEAGKSAAVEGTAETVGKVAGGVAGRAIGAAAGQALIPIPGVGAAVGGFVGGLAGEWVGGKIGKGVGEFMNDWRQGGATKALEDTKDAVKNIGKNVGAGVADAGKTVVKGVVGKVFGWG
ncbi:hypothetical protein GCM10009596_04340 [Arthrobacter rhombi]|uniref:hypothetical protein n=1 Tax=Arthrobacter rhombi TaxID=71253 RepID=UPI0031D9782D